MGKDGYDSVKNTIEEFGQVKPLHDKANND